MAVQRRALCAASSRKFGKARKHIKWAGSKTVCFLVSLLLLVSLIADNNAVLATVRAQGDVEEASDSIDAPPTVGSSNILHLENGNGMDSLVKVYDDVLSVDTANWLHQFAVEEHDRKENHRKEGNPKWGRQFVFPLPQPKQNQQYSPLIRILNDILHQIMMPPSPINEHQHQQPMYYVEFWTRQTWELILAHQDMDEGYEKATRTSETTATTTPPFRHPKYGHVLYLKKGRSVVGPTVVVNATTGGALLAGVEEYGSSSTLVSVPVVPGRLLQFQGDRLHSVPRPHHVYWTYEQEWPPRTEPESEFERSVVLFNLWPYSEEPVMNKLVVGSGEDDEVDNTVKTKILATEEMDRTCNPKSSWKQAKVIPFHNDEDAEGQQRDTVASTTLVSWLSSLLWPTKKSMQQFEIPLIGSERRRGTPQRSIILQSEEGALDNVFQQSREVMSVQVQGRKTTFFGVEF